MVTRSASPSEGKRKLALYEKLERLGEGGFGEASLVRRKDSTKRKIYVMKEVKCSDQDEVIEALREMVTLRILQCHWVVKYKDYFQDGLRVYLVMEYCKGGDLYRVMNEALKKGEKLDEDRVMRWFVQIALGLNEIHEKQFMHRDLKPSNVFLDKKGNAKLGDFGLTNLGGKTPEEKVSATICGTPGFISPEIERGEAYNAKSDVWSLACTLYELLCLRSAFADSIEGVFPQPVPSFYSQGVRDLLSAMLITDCRRRPLIADILRMPIVQKYVELELNRVAVENTEDDDDDDDELDENTSDFSINEFVQLVRNKDVGGVIVTMIQHPKRC